MEWRNLYRGFLIGTSDLIPGVSGGTIAFILGIYDRLLEAIGGIFSKDWKRHLQFLIPLGIGAGAAILFLSKVINYLLKNYFEPTQFFFLGLIIGIIPFIVRQSQRKATFKVPHYIVLFIWAVLLASLAFINPSDPVKITSLTFSNAPKLFFAGWAGSMAMLLPGISGSFVLLMLGFYWTVIGAISDLNIPIILTVGAGIGIGLIVSSRLIHFGMTRFPAMIFASIIGLIVGSVFVIYPGVPHDGTILVMSVLTFIIGLLVASVMNTIHATE